MQNAVAWQPYNRLRAIAHRLANLVMLYKSAHSLAGLLQYWTVVMRTKLSNLYRYREST